MSKALAGRNIIGFKMNGEDIPLGCNGYHCVGLVVDGPHLLLVNGKQELVLGNLVHDGEKMMEFL